MEGPPVYEVTPEEVREFRAILEKQIGRTVEHSDAEVEQMLRNALGLCGRFAISNEVDVMAVVDWWR